MNTRIAKIRKDLGLKQSEFGDATGKSRDTVSNYELGRVIPDDSYLQLLAIKYGYRLEWIRTGELPEKESVMLGDALGQILKAAAAGDPQAAWDYFRARFTDAEILLLYEIFKGKFGDPE